MRHDVKLPKLGDTVDTVLVVEWLVEVGAQVAEGDALLSVETDKVDAEVPAPVSGRLRARLVEPDEEITVGTPICTIES